MTGGLANARFYCLCGATWEITSDQITVEYVIRVWTQAHGDAGHGPATQRQAANARQRQDRALTQREPVRTPRVRDVPDSGLHDTTRDTTTVDPATFKGRL